MEENKAVEAVKAGAELALEQFVEQSYQAVAEELVEKLKLAIPGEKFDFVADLLKEAMGPMLKASLLAQIEKISDKV